jgi:hypothetical protein
MPIEVILQTVAVVLTLLVLSRVVGDNPLFRFSQYLFVGVALGYAVVVAYHQVLRPALLGLATAQNSVQLGARIVPLALGLLLFTRLGSQRASWLANIPLALLFGVGAALAIGGAAAGTLGPQILDTAARPLVGAPGAVLGALMLAIGVILVLSVFYYGAPTPGQTRLRQLIPQGGRWLLIVSFGALFAGAVITYMTALSERLQFVIGWALSLL